MSAFAKGMVTGVVFVLALLIVGFALLPKETSGESAQRETEERLHYQMREAKVISRGIIYFHDERSGLCYGYYLLNQQVDEPILVVVPYENVKHLLINPPTTAPTTLGVEPID